MNPSKTVAPKKLKGFQDYSPQSMSLRFQIMDKVRQMATLAGFSPIGTPSLEYSEVLLGVGGETDKQVFRFMDNGERDVALRFDLTVPFARYVAENFSQLSFPFKRLQIGDVWRAEKPQKGRYREFCQCDLDIIGVEHSSADAEVIGCFASILAALQIGPVTFQLSHRRILSALMAVFLGTPPEAESSLLIAIDKLDKIGKDAVAKLLIEQHSFITPEKAYLFLEILAAKDSEGHTDLKPIEDSFKDHPKGLEALTDLKNCLLYLKQMASHLLAVNFKINLSVARGLGYYTGVVFETTMNEKPSFGSICSGGRYDNLVERFISQPLSGVGGSLGLDRLVAALLEIKEEKGFLIEKSQETKVFIAVAGEENQDYGFSIASFLRQNGVICDIGFKPKKLAHQFKYASKNNFPFVITVGSEEKEHQNISFKKMATGEEIKNLPLKEILSYIKN